MPPMRPDESSTETFIALLFAVCILLALVLLTGCDPSGPQPSPHARESTTTASMNGATAVLAANGVASVALPTRTESDGAR